VLRLNKTRLNSPDYVVPKQALPINAEPTLGQRQSSGCAF